MSKEVHKPSVLMIEGDVIRFNCTNTEGFSTLGKLIPAHKDWRVVESAKHWLVS